ncbi:UbiD family decarboxylase [Chloroflexota bacterium]
MSKDLRQFLDLVRGAGPQYYVEAKRPLSPIYEVTVLAEKLGRANRLPLVYCPRIEGSKLPLIFGSLGSYELLGLAFDIPPEKLRAEGKGCLLQEYRRRRPNTRPPREVSPDSAPVHEVVLKGKDVDLGLLPIVHHYELNPTRYMTMAMVICKDPDTGIPNIGLYRQELKGKNKLCWRIDLGHHGGLIAQRYAELGRPMEVISFVGHHPVVAIGAVEAVPYGKSEFEVMGALLDEPLEVTPGLTVDLPVPARAEIAIEGTVDPGEIVTDGPFSEAYGYYSDRRPCYVIQAKTITMRRDAIYQNLEPSHPEHNKISLLSRDSAVYDKVRAVIPAVKAVHHAPERQWCRTALYISIKKRNPGDGRLAALAGASAARPAKMVVVVDDDIDVYNDQEVLWAIGNRVRAELDVTIIPRLPTGEVNPGGRDESGFGPGMMDAKMLIDATEPEGFATRVMPHQKLWESMKLEDYI